MPRKRRNNTKKQDEQTTEPITTKSAEKAVKSSSSSSYPRSSHHHQSKMKGKPSTLSSFRWSTLILTVLACIAFAFTTIDFTKANNLDGGGGFANNKGPKTSSVGADTTSSSSSTTTRRASTHHSSESTADTSTTTTNDEPAQADAAGRSYTVLEVIPHDASAFTQGLTSFSGKLYESTGLNGHSQVRQLDPRSGLVLKSINMKHEHFGEGMTHYHDANGNDLLIQITWQSKKGFVYDPSSLRVIRQFDFDTHTGEGWGITYDERNEEFIVSDGSQWLHFWDRDTLKETRRIPVYIADPNYNSDNGRRPVNRLNELEFVNGKVLANLWYYDLIVSIDPTTGAIVYVYDFNDLWTERTAEADCFNGISKTDREGEFLVTGKKWPFMYRVKLHNI